jgi:F-box and WD-40 domain protein CDC4
MDPPGWPSSKRRATSVLPGNNGSMPPEHASDGSPSPFTTIPKSAQGGFTSRRPRSVQTVSVRWEEGQDTVSQDTSRLHIELAECVETKTVTTTTTTKRSYPPLLVRQRPLSGLDSKEYPLASKETPPELTNFSFEPGGQLVDRGENERRNLV